jgi:hypothetical protein
MGLVALPTRDGITTPWGEKVAAVFGVASPLVAMGAYVNVVGGREGHFVDVDGSGSWPLISTWFAVAKAHPPAPEQLPSSWTE